MGRGSGGVVSSRKGTKSGTKENVSAAQRSAMMKEIIANQKHLSSLKAQQTKAEKAVKMAQGGVHVAQTASALATAKSELLAATKKLDTVHSKYKDLEKAQDALVKKYQSIS